MNKILICLGLLVVGLRDYTVSNRCAKVLLRLEERSNEFYSQVRYDGDNSSRDKVSRDAQALTESARALNHAVDQRATRDKVAIEYDRVAQNYDRLHQDMADAGYADQNRRVLQDFDRVTEAYRIVESSFADRHAESRIRCRSSRAIARIVEK